MERASFFWQVAPAEPRSQAAALRQSIVALGSALDRPFEGMMYRGSAESLFKGNSAPSMEVSESPGPIFGT